jgi:energy-coupling factor transporter ATP-binding protein EcfA2
MSLRLTQLRVAQLRRFKDPFELRDLQPGLNLITGPNEVGKSTLVRAIRAAFFERYRSKVVDDLRPWGDSGATPSVDIAFELDGQPGQLSKSFLGSKARCDLRWGAQSWSGTDAEDHLAQLMGFAYAGKGASKAEHWGIPGLLWVEQGSGQGLQEAAGHAQSHLHQALQRHLQSTDAAALTATGGDALLHALTEQRDQLLTGTGRPKGPLLEVMQQVERLQAHCQALQDKVQTYRQQVDQLARLRAEHLRDEASQPWAQLQSQLDQARLALQQAEQARSQWTDAQQQLTHCEARQALLLQQLTHFEQQAEQAEQRRRQVAQVRARWQLAEAPLQEAQQQTQAAQVALTQAQQRWRQAQRADQRQRLVRQREALTLALASERAALARAREAENAVQTARQHVISLRGSAADLQRLRQLDREAHQLRLRMQDLATRIEFRLLPGQTLTLSGAEGLEPLQGHGERLLTRTTTVSLPGVGELSIQPGGEDLEVMAKRLQATEDALAEALRAMGVTDLAAAEHGFEQHAQQMHRLQLAQQALALMAPQGVAACVAQVDERERELQLATQALSNEVDTTDITEEAGASQAWGLAAAEAQVNQALQVQAQASQALSAAQSHRAAISAELEAAEREWQVMAQQLNAPERQQAQAHAQAQWVAVKAEGQAQAQRVAQLQAQLAQSRPDILSQDVQRYERSLAQTLQAHQQRATQTALLAQSLAQQGAQGLEEALALGEGELARAVRRQAELQLRADALSLLCHKLQAKRQAALNRLQAPLQRHLQRYLDLLFPGGTVTVSDALVPTELSRPGRTGLTEVGDFDALSFGAREQLALVSRFAYADLLREAGRPTLIILDDALVHSDAERLALMKRVVFDASQRHQVLLFSCHPESWRDMGVVPMVLAP